MKNENEILENFQIEEFEKRLEMRIFRMCLSWG